MTTMSRPESIWAVMDRQYSWFARFVNASFIFFAAASE
jgi:hypothetical protein